MAVYAIGDLHLSFSSNKPMDKFGDNWIDHHEQIQLNWRQKVNEEDMVLILGDISWAMNLDEALQDLQWIHELPGQKVCIRGNHDYWWKSIGRLNQLFDDIIFLQNDSIEYQGYAICGSRGYLCPNDYKFTEQDEKLYKREYQRMKLSLEKAKKKGYNEIIVMMHYPPTNDQKEPSLFTELFEEYKVKKVFYGHLHGEKSFYSSLIGQYNGTEYQLVSADFLNFNLYPITDW